MSAKLDISLIYQYLEYVSMSQYLEYVSMSVNLWNKWKASIYLQFI